MQQNDKSYELISIMVPVFNEENSIPELYDRLVIKHDKISVDYKIIFRNR